MDQTYTLNEIDTLARTLLDRFAQPQDRAVMFALSGDLGAGKTTLVQSSARQLGVAETVTSPTFVLQKIYPLSGQPFERLIHMDAYRLESPEEMRALNWETLLASPANIIFLEWAERVASIVPSGALWFDITIVDEDTRRITLRR